MIDLITLILVVIVNLAFILLILSRDFRKLPNILYAILTFLLIAWTTLNYFSNQPSSYNTLLLVNRFSFATGLILVCSVWVFSMYFPRRTKKHTAQRITATIVTPVVFILTALTPYAVISVRYASDRQVTDVTTGFGYILYNLALLMFFGFIIKNFRAIYREKSTDILTKQQITYTGWGIAITFIWSVVTATLLPQITGNWAISKLGIAGSLFLGTFTGIAVVRHKLFDIRSFVARASVYILSVGIFALIYSVAVYGVSAIFIDLDNVTYLQRGLFAALALLIAVTYSPVLKFFNRVTRRLFYRDAYNTQEVLDQVGKIIVGNIDLHKIQKSSLEVFMAAMRPVYGGFVLKSASGSVGIQDFAGEVPHFETDQLMAIIKQIGKRLTIYDEIGDSTSELAKLMRSNDISLIMPLITKNEIIGHFIAGPRKSGNVFNQQDKDTITIAANELAVALQNAQRFEEIQAFNVTLQEKVAEATRELKQTNRKLVALDEAKDEFISMASHQLRTPLTSIKGYLSMLLDGDLGKVNKDQEKALKEAFGSSQRMVYLIADFLNVSRIKTGKFMIEPKEVYLPEMVREEILQLGEMTDAKDLKLVYEQPEVFPKVMLDDNKIRQVMMNMADNAIYYTPAGGTITIQLYATAQEIIFKVVDTGIGVPKSEQHKLFAKFYRAGNARKARPDGTGLGLFMAQKIVAEQGGAIIFESTERKGSTFGFRFPLAKVRVKQ